MIIGVSKLSGEALQIAVKRREAKSKGEKERYKHLKAEYQRTARRDKKAFLSDQCKEIEENNRMGKTRDLFKKIRDPKGTFHAKMGSIKDRNCTDLEKAVAPHSSTLAWQIPWTEVCDIVQETGIKTIPKKKKGKKAKWLSDKALQIAEKKEKRKAKQKRKDIPI